MKRTSSLSCAAALGLLAILTSGSFGQPAGAQQTKVIDLSFPGGNVVEYVEAVRDAAGGGLNVLVSPEAIVVRLDPVELRRVGVQAAILLLDGYRVEFGDRGIKIDIDQVPSPPMTEPIYRLKTQTYTAGAPGRDSSMVWSLTDLIAGSRGPEDVLMAVETALELFGDEYRPARMRYHPETGLLIVRAHQEQLQSIDTVVDELRARGGGPDFEAQMKKLRVEAEAKIATLQDRAGAAEDETRHLVRDRTQWEARAEIFERELAQREEDIEGCRDRLRNQADLIAALKRRIQDMEQAMLPPQ